MPKSRVTQDQDIGVSFLVYILGFAFVIAGDIFGLSDDLFRPFPIIIAFDLVVLVCCLASITLLLLRLINNRIALGIIFSAAAINFTVAYLSYVFRFGLVGDNAGYNAMNATFNMLIVIFFVGLNGFLVSKHSLFVAGPLLIGAFACGVIVDYMLFGGVVQVVIIGCILVGYVFAVYYWRDYLESSVSNLHSVQKEIEGQRDEMEALKVKAERALDDLTAAQSKIVAQEKLASLGALTAGIAHEIKNPLNFITNFSESSGELLAELSEHVQKVRAHLDEDSRKEVDYLIGELTQNMKDIHEHGSRGDHIVKSMLMHSRSGSANFTVEALNPLVEECLNLAYHGLRAQNSTFQANRSFIPDPGLEPVSLVRGDISRVLINMCNNAFYSVNKKRESSPAEYRPTVIVRTKSEAKFVVIEIEDNGLGIPAEVQSKLFVPFYTTKPTGEGTGLGLSMSNEIVSQEHGGSISVESEPGLFARFTIRIPKK